MIRKSTRTTAACNRRTHHRGTPNCETNGNWPLGSVVSSLRRGQNDVQHGRNASSSSTCPQLGTIVNGKLDAVFFGGLDETDETKRYTVVDWKTGVKPRKPDEIKEKLAQLDLYRLLLAAMEGVPLDAIDACLYYVSEPHEADRELDALDKTEEEILAELSYGIPQQSDND